MFTPNVLHIDVSAEQKLFFVSDTHFNHRKLVQSCPDHFDGARKYLTTEEMDRDIVEQWNKTVSDNDIVIFMGDFFMNCPVRDTVWSFYNYKQYLRGNIYWLYGNHDGVVRKKIKSFPFYDVADIRKKVVDKYCVHYIAQHYPFGEVPYYLDSQFSLHGNDKTWLDNLVLVHGHTHLSERTDSVDFGQYGKLHENNACWEAWYRPVQSVELLFAKEVFIY